MDVLEIVSKINSIAVLRICRVRSGVSSGG